MKFNSADEFFKQCGEYQVVLRRYDSTGTFYDASVTVTLEELYQHFAVRANMPTLSWGPWGREFRTLISDCTDANKPLPIANDHIFGPPTPVSALDNLKR